MEKYFYVRKDSTLANDDDNVNGSNLFPVSAFKGAEATSDTELVLYFNQRINWGLAADSATTEGASDKVTLTVTTNKHKQVLQAIADSLSDQRTNAYRNSMMIVLFDAVTTEAISSFVTAATPSLAAANA